MKYSSKGIYFRHGTITGMHVRLVGKVGIAPVRRKRESRMDCTNGEKLRPVSDGTPTDEQFWEHQLQRIKDRAEQRQRESNSDKPSSRT